MRRISLLILAIFGIAASAGCEQRLQANVPPLPSVHERLFDILLAKHPNLTFRQLSNEAPKPPYLEKLSFDPATAKFYDETVKRLQLTDAEQEMLQRQGLVSLDYDQHYSFGSIYEAVYSHDLPVLVTTDSILHAMHRSYDDILMQLEQKVFIEALNEILGKCEDQLAALSRKSGAPTQNLEDVDLYITVALNLIGGAGAPQAPKMNLGVDGWDGSILVHSKLGQDNGVKKILSQVQSRSLQDPLQGQTTSLYGGERAIDFSQFQPRGHYLKTVELSRYFRAMMWLGRADTGWIILPPDPESAIASQSDRELRDAVLLTQLLRTTGAIDRLRQVSDIIDFLVGHSDNFTVFQLADLLDKLNIQNLNDLANDTQLETLKKAIRSSDLGLQQIRSQVVLSDPNDLHQVPPPSIFQMFGQRFVIDSFVLSKVVYDSIIFEGQKIERYMPTGLDIAIALGNDSALPLVEQEMAKFPYASNLKACQEYVGQFQPTFWQENLYNIWLNALSTLHADLSAEKHLPECMRTEAWQRKQLQAQLASWAQLRHDNVLYAKQSYTSEERCEYPAGYVEPYPETFARIKFFAAETARRIGNADFKLESGDHSDIQKRQVEFFQQMAETLGKLESLARKELAGEPFTDEEQAWLKKVIVAEPSHFCGAPPTYSGWYCKLFYGDNSRSVQSDPTIVDVHTDPNSKLALEEAVGDCTFLVVAIDNDADRQIYVGPAYTYYEFPHPAEDRLTDEAWSTMLMKKAEPPRPAWTDIFQPPKLNRGIGRTLP